MGLALGKHRIDQGASRAQGFQGQPLVEQPRRARADHFDGESSQMLLEPRPPKATDLIAGLEGAPHPPPAAAPDQPRMAAMSTGHQMDDGGGLAMLGGGQHDAVIAPFHILTPSPARRTSPQGKSSQIVGPPERRVLNGIRTFTL